MVAKPRDASFALFSRLMIIWSIASLRDGGRSSSSGFNSMYNGKTLNTVDACVCAYIISEKVICKRLAISECTLVCCYETMLMI